MHDFLTLLIVPVYHVQVFFAVVLKKLAWGGQIHARETEDVLGQEESSGDQKVCPEMETVMRELIAIFGCWDDMGGQEIVGGTIVVVNCDIQKHGYSRT